MDGFLKVSLKKLIENIGEDRVKAILSEFYCPLNSDIEVFLRAKAVEFERQGISADHFEIWCGEISKTVTSINDVMTIPFF